MIKKYVVFILLILFSAKTFSQNQNMANAAWSNPIPYSFVNVYNVQPHFPGGQESLLAFIEENMQYPEIATRYGVRGRAEMSFLVDIDGSVKDVATKKVTITKINESTFSSLPRKERKELKKLFVKAFEDEASRIISKMPKWKPGEQQIGGSKRLVEVRYTLPVVFDR